ncbi:PQQ-dependent sugar dehydrogenase [Pelagibacteraceae bacterium]|nr:PQQ-dependent sugar dehydrogenase [Pelagibacteraceae bacterium]
MKKINFLILIIWILSIIVSILWTFENPEKIEKIKSYFNKKKITETKVVNESLTEVIANSFHVNFNKVLEINDKTAFVIHKRGKNFNTRDLEIYTQSGTLIKNLKSYRIRLPDHFTLQRNGGIKTIISYKGKRIALISSSEKDCFFASLILIENNQELFRSKCLPEVAKNNDFNGLGSSNVHFQNSILFSLGTPEKHMSKNSLLAQKDNSNFGKILEIKKSDLEKKITGSNANLNINVFSKGHRVPQGLTILNGEIFNVEHGPKGGDELNKVKRGQNYGWPEVSYGTNYLKDGGGDGVSFKVSHEKNGFVEPLFAFLPSVGISNLNNCPNALKNYYKKNCLIGLSLYGNNLRKGYSIIIFLLNEKLNKVDSIEKISLGNLVLRHFVTDENNILYEDENGNIYISADKKGIYKISFSEFR